jgi:hypothetical protein
MTPRMEIAETAYNGKLPDWVRLLVDACDAQGSSQNQVAKRIGYSGSAVSNLIRNSYGADLNLIKERVLVIYAPERVTCPALGDIGSEDCLGWRLDAIKLTSAAPLAVRMFRACRKCPRNAKPEQGQDQ